MNNALTEYLLKVLQKGENGLYLAETPTGSGKTYAAVQAMIDFVWGKYADNPGRIIFMTSQKKNLLDLLSDLKKCCFRKHGAVPDNFDFDVAYCR